MEGMVVEDNLAKEYHKCGLDLFHSRLIYYLNRLSLVLAKHTIYEHHPGDKSHRHGVWAIRYNRTSGKWNATWYGDKVATCLILKRLANELITESGCFNGLTGIQTDNLWEEVRQFIADYEEAIEE